MIAFSGLCRENATMVERGLIQTADAVEVISGVPSKSRYVPLVLPRSGDIATTLAVFYTPEPPNGSGIAPSEYMLVLGEGDIRIDLEGVSTSGTSEVRISYDAGRLAMLVDKVERTDGVTRSAHADNSVGECQDLVIGYRLYARSVGEKWTQYLHGPLTFQCNEVSDMLDKSAVHPAGITPRSALGKPRTPGGHKFDHGIGQGPGGFDGSFLSDETVTAGGSGESLMPTSGTVLIDIWSGTDGNPSSKYVPLVVSRCDDVDQLIGTTRLRTTDHTHAEQPDQFMLLLDEDVMRIQLELHGADVRLVKTAREIQDICDQLLAAAPESERTGFKTHENDCRDILIQYRLFGRKLTDAWIDYAHGSLLFQCCGDYALPDAHGKIRTPYAGPFMTRQSPSFMPQFMSSKDEEA